MIRTGVEEEEDRRTYKQDDVEANVNCEFRLPPTHRAAVKRNMLHESCAWGIFR